MVNEVVAAVIEHRRGIQYRRGDAVADHVDGDRPFKNKSGMKQLHLERAVNLPEESFLRTKPDLSVSIVVKPIKF